MSSVVNYSGMERDLTQHGASRVLWTALHNSRICDDGSIQLDTRCASPLVVRRFLEIDRIDTLYGL